MYYSIIILAIVIVTALGLFINKRAYNKGVDAGRLQVLEEELIRMDRNQKTNIDKKVKDFYNTFSEGQKLSRQSCKFVESADVIPAV